MRIVMVGHSNAGKTSYMALMYQIMNKGHKGFRIQANNQSYHYELINNAKGIESGRYPPPTSRHSDYDFTLSYKEQTVSRFTWNDYRGGALSERSTSADMASFTADLKRADALIIFVDAYQLATGAESSRGIGRLTALVQGAITERQAPMPVVLTYTKADLVKTITQWSAALEPFSQLSQAMAASRNVTATTVTVACKKHPKAIRVPVLWCLSYGITNQISSLRESAAMYEERANNHRKRSSTGVFDWMKAGWEASVQRNEYREEARAKLAQLEPLVQPAADLAAALVREQRKNGPPRVFRNASS